MKTCIKCFKIKELQEFHFRKDNQKYRNTCKKCWYARTYSNRKDYYYAEYFQEWRRKNVNKSRAATKKYRLANPHINTESAAKRRVRVKQQTPIWLTFEQKQSIKLIYKNCPEGLHVDHIVPLRGKNVSGLHVPWNLQYLEPAVNFSKGSR